MQRTSILILVFGAAILGCGGGSSSGGAGGSGAGGGSGATGSSSGSGSGSSSSGGGSLCPRVILGSTLPISHQGDATGAPNLVESPRLEWGMAPDDTLLFTAPAAGTYLIGMPSEPSKNQGCGASIQEFASVGTTKYYDESWCPAAGAVKMIDGIYAATGGTTSTFQMTQGQKVLIWVSCTTWSDAQQGPYTLTIEKM